MKGKLTDRQQEIFDLLEEGNTPSQVAKKAKPALSTNAVYMTIKRIEAKGSKPKVKSSPRGRAKGSKKPAKPAPKPPAAKPEAPAPEEPVLSGAALVEQIKRQHRKDRGRIRKAIKANRADKERADKQIDKLNKELSDLENALKQIPEIK